MQERSCRRVLDRSWWSLKNQWMTVHLNGTKKKGHNVLSPLVFQMVHQWAWRQSMSREAAPVLERIAIARKTLKKMGQSEHWDG